MVSGDPSRIEVGNSENDGMHGIEPRCEVQRVNDVHRRLQQVGGYHPVKMMEQKKNYMRLSVAKNVWWQGAA